MFVVVLGGVQWTATAKTELLPHALHGAAHRSRAGERTEVASAVFLFESSESKAGNGVLEVDLEQEKSFVVPETDVVAGLELLDEFSFEQESFGLVLYGMGIQIVDGIHQCIELEIPALSA